MKYKVYWRKAGIKPEMGSKFLEIVNEKKPKNFLEIGVYTGVNARNVCDLQSKLFNSDFGYLGIDLFDITGYKNHSKTSFVTLTEI